MKMLFTKENLPMTAVVALVTLAWLSLISVLVAHI